MKLKPNNLVTYIDELGFSLDKVKKASNGLASDNYIGFVNEKPLFVKTLFTEQWPLSKQEEEHFHKYEKDVFVSHYRLPRNQRSGKSIVDLEANVLSLWNKHNIPSPELLFSDNKTVNILSYLEATPLSNHFENLTPEQTENIIEQIHAYRTLAKQTSNPYFLHNDLHPHNILVSQKESYFIDPGLEFNKNMSVDELDAHLNLFFMYSVLGNYFLNKNTSESAKQSFVSSYIDSLSSSDKKMMAQANNFTHPEYLNLLQSKETPYSQEQFAWWNQFNKENYSKLQNLLE